MTAEPFKYDLVNTGREVLAQLALPLSLDYAGLWLGSAMVLFFGLVSDRSLIYLVRSARITGSASYYECGARCLGAVGAKAVLVSLGALMFAAGETGGRFSRFGGRRSLWATMRTILSMRLFAVLCSRRT